MHETHEAARAVAALLDFSAVGIPDTIAEIGVRALRLFHEQHLIAADAEMPVRESLRELRCDLDAPADAVDHDEVVARALHLGEFQYHFGSPSGRVLKRLCVQKYCSGISRTRSSMKAFMRRVSAASSSPGKFSQTG